MNIMVSVGVEIEASFEDLVVVQKRERKPYSVVGLQLVCANIFEFLI